jgi:iron-sulfur cluster assembly accessory protein
MDTTSCITLSQTAIDEIRRLRANYPAEEPVVLIIEAAQGGCMDWYYKLSFMAKSNVGDRPTTTHEDIEYTIPETSRLLLDGLHIDYSDDLMGGGFRFSNPNTDQTCGCGTSFSSQVFQPLI